MLEGCCSRLLGAITGEDLREGKDNLALIPSKVQGSENLYAAVPFSFSPRDGTWIPLIFDVSLLRPGCDAVTLESGPAAFVKYKLLLMLPSADQEAHLAG